MEDLFTDLKNSMRKLFLFLTVFVVSCNRSQIKTKQREGIIVKKYTEQVSINNIGNFTNVYYFLYDNDELDSDIGIK